MEASKAAIDNARILEALVEKITKQMLLWDREERKDARILVAILIEQSLTADHARKAAAEALG